MTSKVNITYYDFSKESSSVGLRGVDLTAANFTAQMGLIDDVVDAIQGVTLATKIKDQRIATETEFTKTLPTSPYAQRESKWLVKYTDNVNPLGNGSFEIPGANLDLLVSGEGVMNLNSTEGAALVAALQAWYRSRLGNAVTISEIEHVGRNN